MKNYLLKAAILLLITDSSKINASINVWGSTPTKEAKEYINSLRRDNLRCCLLNCSEESIFVKTIDLNFQLYMSDLFQCKFSDIDISIYTQEQRRWLIIIQQCIKKTRTESLTSLEKQALESVEQDIFCYARGLNKSLKNNEILIKQANSSPLLTIDQLIALNTQPFTMIDKINEY